MFRLTAYYNVLIIPSSKKTACKYNSACYEKTYFQNLNLLRNYSRTNDLIKCGRIFKRLLMTTKA